MRENEAIVGDLMTKAGVDVTAAIRRTLAICPAPHLPVVLAAAAAAIGTVTAVLDELCGGRKKEPSPENIMLAALLAARAGMKGYNGPEDGVSAAYRDIETLKKAGRLTAASNGDRG